MTIDFSTLPERVQQELFQEYANKLNAAKALKEELLGKLVPVDEEINAYDKLVNAFKASVPPKAANLLSGDGSKYDGKYEAGESYDPKWPHAKKIKYVADRPQKYGFKTLKGSGGVVDAILKEEPEWLDSMPTSATGKRGTLIGKLAPIISRMVDPDNKQLIKLRTKGTKNEFHFVSADWFYGKDENKVKPEYASFIADLEVVDLEKKLAPALTGANAESETNVGEQSSTDATDKLNGHSYGQLSLSNSH